MIETANEWVDECMSEFAYIYTQHVGMYRLHLQAIAMLSLIVVVVVVCLSTKLWGWRRCMLCVQHAILIDVPRFTSWRPHLYIMLE